MNCSQDLGATLEEDGELTITPVCDIKSNRIMKENLYLYKFGSSATSKANGFDFMHM